MATHNLPPSYEEAIAIAKTYAEQHPEALSRELIKGLNNQDAYDEVVKQVKTLKQVVQVTDRNFENVSSVLALYDAIGGVEPLKNTWDAIHQKFKDTIKTSKNIALEAKQSADEYLHIVLPAATNDSTLGKASYEEKLAIIDEFIAKVTKTSVKSKEMVNEFNGLKEEVRAVEKKMKKDYLGVLGETEVKITNLKKEIVDLESKLEDLQSMLNTVLNFLGVGVAVGGAGTGLVIAAASAATVIALGPWGIGLIVIGAIVALGAGIAAIYAAAKSSSLREDIVAKKKELEILESKYKKLQALKEYLDQAASDMQGIQTSLDSIGGMWQAMHDDASEVKRLLEEARAKGKDESLSPETFRMATAVYRHLGDVLTVYAMQV
ncbi:hypothetical protein BDN72DRAFT_959490 [Pluteus cervinus]|uniref:Uncharacterized protein n=1 Tax=Pluteus cervinus TaxID=181527 RepID=A0ACD3AVZ6_9AGAR|nr:hypothetical protein BDN72DRAFT_959490 [Pluteus cervinus]